MSKALLLVGEVGPGAGPSRAPVLTPRKPLILPGLREILFVWSFFSGSLSVVLVRAVPLFRIAERVKCLRLGDEGKTAHTGSRPQHPLKYSWSGRWLGNTAWFRTPHLDDDTPALLTGSVRRVDP